MKTEENLIIEVENHIKTFAKVFSKPQFAHFEQIIKGIQFSSKKSINQYSKSHSKSQSALCRFMNSKAVNDENIAKIMKEMIISKLDENSDIDCIIDDSIKHHKHAKQIFGLGNHHDHLNGGYSNGQSLVTCGVYQNLKFYPTNCEIYQQEGVCETSSFKTKIEIAINMLKEWIDKVDNVLIDSWYSAKEILKLIVKNKKYFFTMLKRNRNFKSNHKIKRQLQEWEKYLDPKKFEIITIGKQVFAVQEKIGYLPNVGKVKILFSKFYDKKTKLSKKLHY